LKSIIVIALLVTSWFAYNRINGPITFPPGVLIANAPTQQPPPNEIAFAYKDFQIKPLATFALDARVLHRKIYRYDSGAGLAPVDLAVGWGQMSDEAVLDRLDVSQSARFYFYEWQGQPPIPREEIISHSTNLHLIPSNNEIASECKSLRTGELVHLSGLLVEATGPDIGTLRSSLSRTDSGKGACEIVWVEEIHKLAR
jgi:hypothetical protein